MLGLKVFGKLPSGSRLKRIETSANYADGHFQTIEPTEVLKKDVSYVQLFKENANKSKSVRPAGRIPAVKTNLSALNTEEPTIIWFGHSSYLISSQGCNILVDPVFSGNASPVSFFAKAFDGADSYKVPDMPPIDILVLTHDHYDHLDYDTILKIYPTVRKIVTSLGVGSHLEYWGINADKIIELDWWEGQVIAPGVEITATPARHFSGRLFTRGKTLWSSFALNLFGSKIFIGGDSGYDDQFKIIGEKFGPFDLALLECGQYGHNWPNIHMMPEETVTAAQNLNAAILMPVHWGKFVLSTHPWNEPPKRVMAAAIVAKQPIIIPVIGQPYIIGEDLEQTNWWDID